MRKRRRVVAGVLRGVYAALMFALAGYLTFAPPAEQIAAQAEDECAVVDDEDARQ